MFIVAEEEDDFSPFFIVLLFFLCVSCFFNLTGFSEGISVGNQKEELRIRTQSFKI